MKNPVVVIGIGEMGSVFARGFLCMGHPVYPAPRGRETAEIAQQVARPELDVVAIAENDIQQHWNRYLKPGVTVWCCYRMSYCPTTGGYTNLIQL